MAVLRETPKPVVANIVPKPDKHKMFSRKEAVEYLPPTPVPASFCKGPTGDKRD